jgi:hypothetical protein
VTTTFPSGTGSVEARPSWREERRRDAETSAANDERRADAAQRRKFEAAEKKRELKAKARDDRRQEKIQARQDRSDRVTAAGNWCKTHVRGLALVAVIGVPGVLAADGQADWGMQQWGPLGLILPAFSEGTAWYFALSAEHARKENPVAPVWHLRLGTWVFAAIGAALNFVHGVAQGGLASGITMGVTSAAGITSHQIVKAGPRQSRQQRRDARLARKRARLESRVMNAALEDGTVVLSADGRSRITVRPGAVTLRRTWLGTRRLESARDIEEEIGDVTRAALLLVDRAEAEASRALAQAEQCTQLVRKTRHEASLQAGEAGQLKALAEIKMAQAEEMAGKIRAAVDDALARAAAAEEARAAAVTEASKVRAAYQGAMQTLEDAARQLEQGRSREAAATARAAAADAARADAMAEADQTRAAYQEVARERAQAIRQAEDARRARADAEARAQALDREMARAQAMARRGRESKKDWLLRLYKEHPEYLNVAAASKTAGELAAVIDYSPGSARRDINQHLREAGIRPAPVTTEPDTESAGEEEVA